MMYLVLLHLATQIPVGSDGPYTAARCYQLVNARTQYDDRHDDAVLTRHGFQWGCVTDKQVALFVRLNHCDVGQSVKSKYGGVAKTYECVGK
jgi:hypothetical protein